MSSLRSVLLLCWRDTGHPQGGGSEAYLQRIGAQLAASGIAVTLRTARYPGAARHEVVDGVRVSRAGGRYSVYVWALLAMAWARLGLGPLRKVRPDVVVDTQNGLPFLARLIYGRRVVVLSRLVPHKQIEDALEAVARLLPRIPGLHLDIVGDGWWRERLVEHVRRMGINSAVTFHGHVDDVTKHHVLQCAWVHLLPSRKEGWGLAVVEAAQHQVPTIGYRSSGGLSDSIVDEVTGILVDSHSELVDRLEELLADPVLRDQLGAKAHTRSEEFSWPQSADAMCAVLEAVQAGRTVHGLVTGRG